MMPRLRVMIFTALLATSLVMPTQVQASRPQVKQAVKSGTADPRYASYVLDSNTGEVLHAQHADARRYPASLTKMMTLYLLFEALENGTVKMNTRMPVSTYAALQPQTNISLSTADKVPVETAIRALIIRSANDVSVVVAEYLGRTESGFSAMMNAKARALGMRNTHFKNPNGLPNPAQISTARDMAKLGIALRRDFPQYYHYFNDKQFSWRGVTYYTHNRVNGRFTGADGIKTGYTIASGFNLVTSAERGGKRIVGVVLGGNTARWRDDRMIALLGQTYRTLASRGGNQKGIIYAENLPIDLTAPTALAAADQRVAASAPRPAAPQVATQPAEEKFPENLPFQTQLRSDTAIMRGQGDETTEGDWGIQVGAFSDRTQAERAANQAYQTAQNTLKGSRITVVGSATGAPVRIHRARLENISEAQAKSACEMLIAKNAPCFIYRTGTP